MSSLTRWVLAHKRIVVGIWVALTIAGMAAPRPGGREMLAGAGAGVVGV